MELEVLMPVCLVRGVLFSRRVVGSATATAATRTDRVECWS